MSLGLGLNVSSGSYTSEFTLTDISDLSLWLKNGVGITAAKWDSSATPTNFVSADVAQRGTVAGGGLDLDGTNDFYEVNSNIDIAQNGGFCMAAVIELENVSNATIVAGDSAAKEQMAIINATNFRFRATDTTTTTFVFPSNTFNTNKMLIMLNRTAGASNRFTFSKNGNPLTPDVDNSVNEAQGENPKPFDFTFLGAIGPSTEDLFNGKILEFAFWSKSLSTQEQADVNSYLQDIHGL